MPSQSTFLKKAWQGVAHNPQLRNTEMWLVWMIPTVLVPTLRFMEDTNRDVRDRLKLSARDLFAYMGGTAINFSLMPLSAVVFNQFKATKKRAGLLSVIVGSTASATYSGIGANKFAGRMNKRLFGEDAANNLTHRGDVFHAGKPPEAYANTNKEGHLTFSRLWQAPKNYSLPTTALSGQGLKPINLLNNNIPPLAMRAQWLPRSPHVLGLNNG
jgi:hypothetical protein